MRETQCLVSHGQAHEKVRNKQKDTEWQVLNVVRLAPCGVATEKDEDRRTIAYPLTRLLGHDEQKMGRSCAAGEGFS